MSSAGSMAERERQLGTRLELSGCFHHYNLPEIVKKRKQGGPNCGAQREGGR